MNKILGLKVNTSELLQKGEEIRLRSKDVMKRTQAEMVRINKGQEYDVPPLLRIVIVDEQRKKVEFFRLPEKN